MNSTQFLKTTFDLMAEKLKQIICLLNMNIWNMSLKHIKLELYTKIQSKKGIKGVKTDIEVT